MAVIEAVGLGKRYGDRAAVINLSFRVEPGSVTGFLGPQRLGQVHHDAADARPRTTATDAPRSAAPSSAR
jgi:ABC-type phosphonate transport system ATPase subunit